MTRIISCVNQKGGVGKTTLCANLAHALASLGKRVLVIDADPQGHLSQHLGVVDDPELGLFSVLQEEHTLLQASVKVTDSIALIPPGRQLVRLESVHMKPGRGLLLRKAMQQAALEEFDFVLLDCPPSNGFLVVNAIAASKELLIPVTPDYLGLSGLSKMAKQIKRYEQVMGDFTELWIVISRFQRRAVNREAEQKIRFYFGDKVTPQVIFERAATAESPGHGMSVLQYAPNSKSSDEFVALAEQISQRGE
ncbi:ParA family protein [Alteromonas sediminis]|uniref:ParA family protein n=1 Tax=Alteromonas sediminis TaxID=2259342 RepID=A0A3N5Y5H7_9ALTE|nr:ParA family protein [Alteromonas sediminis]RPJ68336.1 ParA family protein [Alteromonas sediminis]